MTGELVTQVVTAASPFMLAVFAWLTKRRIDNRAAEDSRINARLENQRADFQAVIGPLQAGYETLQTRVTGLEKRVARSEADVHILTGAVRDTLEYLDTRYQDPGPVLPDRVNHLISGGT